MLYSSRESLIKTDQGHNYCISSTFQEILRTSFLVNNRRTTVIVARAMNVVETAITRGPLSSSQCASWKSLSSGVSVAIVPKAWTLSRAKEE